MRFPAIPLAVLIALFPSLQGFAQTQPSQPAQPVSVVLPEGTKVRVRNLVQLSSRTANVGDVFDGEVVEDIDVNGKIVIARGATALGVITAVERARFLGRPGRLGFTFEYARAVDGKRVPLRATTERVGQNREALTWGLALFVTVLAIFIKGNEMEIPPGSVFTTFVDRDSTIELSPPPTPVPAASPSPPPPPEPLPTPTPTPTPPPTQGGGGGG